MSIFVKAIPARKPRTSDSQMVTYMYAVILVLFALAQLYTFDEFLILMESFMLPGGVPVSHLMAGVIVASEVLALPFLLGLKLSKLMRVISMVLGWLVPLIWLELALWLILMSSNINNVGFLGTVVDLTPGMWAVFVSVALAILAGWASWGMWPFEANKKHK